MKHLTVGSLKVHIEHKGDAGEALGSFSASGSPTIQLWDQDKNQLFLTLFHEALHAVSWAHGMKLSERDVRCLEQTLPALFRDNPQFLAMLTAWCKAQ